ncbi:MAG: Ig-like domain-containing protein [Acidobacteria bacterium]|nr:Ig-like domain-containing protein [Acidobacteriota bacterium]
MKPVERVGTPRSHAVRPLRSSFGRPGTRLMAASCLVFCMLASVAFAQTPVPTSHGDNARTGANTNEGLLTPGNIDKNNFGRLFSYPLDYQALAQPLYVPNVNIPGKGVHNVVYVATMADTVYAFDAESNGGANATPLWQVNFTDPGNGITTASGAFLPCATTEDRGPGFTQEGIVATPAIDTVTNTMYVVAKILDNGTVRHQLHALDVATGQEKPGSPVTISATITSNAGTVVNFNSLHQKNRPGLLFLNGIVYLAFGSNYCNDNNHSWVLGYDGATLQQTGVFNTNPDHGLTSIWQAGGGLAADDAGYIYPLTSEGNFDVDTGGQGYTHAVLKLDGNLDLVDYFIPGSVAFLNAHDLDLSGCSPLVLPDLEGPFPHVIVASGKQGTIYVLNRDLLGMYAPNDTQIIQELVGVVGSMRGAPAYWNGRLYFSAKADFLKVFSISGGMLSSAPVASTTLKLTGAHAPSISANGNTNGIVWEFNGGQLYAYDAISLKMLYNSHQMSRDNLPEISHFVTQTVANGRVYMATRTTLEVFGLRHYMSLIAGANQTAPVKTPLPQPIQVQAVQAYSNVPFPGVTVTFSDGGKGGSFNPASATTDSSGIATTVYTTPAKVGTYTLTASSVGFGDLLFSASATAGAPVRMVNAGGPGQTGPAGTVLPILLGVTVQDANKNGVPNVTVTFDDGGKGGILTPSTLVTDAAGKARVSYQLPNLPGKVIVVANSTGLKAVKFGETAVIGPPANVAIISGDSQSATVTSPLPQSLAVKVTDQGGNAVAGTSVTFTAPSGSFTGSPATTDSGGSASAAYTAGTIAGPVTITATAGSASASFHETITPGPPSSVTVSGGDGQIGPAGSLLPQPLAVIVADQYANPVSGVDVVFDDAGSGGQFSGNPVATDNTGTALDFYQLPGVPGGVTISASAAGVGSPALFTEVAQ